MNSHFVRAAIGTAIAVSALEMIRKDKNHLRDYHDGEEHEEAESDEDSPDSTALVPSSREKSDQQNSQHHHYHTAQFTQDSAAAYRLGRKVMGNKDHSIVLLIAETLGAFDLLSAKGSTV
ncbi:uncharacterized protein PAC_18644 [Phialocephala subalpina]|uniref:Uncharacterized protein n=1 Tax=Phialocephala subalpina TaxID=576137 RepID=A0A1L7XUQ4_9HELO|nr:uncharacterized protein PAC_18644 [Phialocephala subalpina]